MDRYIGRAQAEMRFLLLLIGAFAGISALSAGVGLYLALAIMVRMRLSEIGARMAFGAAPTRIFRLIAALASWLPARRAASLDPTKALRRESRRHFDTLYAR